MNGDGIKDILSGCYSQSGHAIMTGSFWILEGKKDKTFAAAKEIMGSDNKILSTHKTRTNQDLTENICTHPFAVDWNGDGDLDIISGNFKGSFFLFEGEGKGKFKPMAIELKNKKGKSFSVSKGKSAPFVIDWDGDGDLDLLSGSGSGNIYWSENKAKSAKGAPELSDFKILIPLPSNKTKGPIKNTRIYVADFNSDGKLDIIVGDRTKVGKKNTGNVWVYTRK